MGMLKSICLSDKNTDYYRPLIIRPLSNSSTRSRDLPPESRDQLYPSLLGPSGHMTWEEGHVTSLTSWRATCDISTPSFDQPTNF